MSEGASEASVSGTSNPGTRKSEAWLHCARDPPLGSSAGTKGIHGGTATNVKAQCNYCKGAATHDKPAPWFSAKTTATLFNHLLECVHVPPDVKAQVAVWTEKKAYEAPAQPKLQKGAPAGASLSL